MQDPAKKAKKIADSKDWKACNKIRIAEYNSQYQVQNADVLKAKRVEKRQGRTEEDKAAKSQYQKQWVASNPDYHSIKQQQRREAKPWEARLRDSVRYALGRQQIVKSKRTEELLGCTIEEAKAHLASMFTDGMSWDNHGESHIDHIRPCASFDLKRS